MREQLADDFRQLRGLNIETMEETELRERLQSHCESIADWEELAAGTTVSQGNELLLRLVVSTLYMRDKLVPKARALELLKRQKGAALVREIRDFPNRFLRNLRSSTSKMLNLFESNHDDLLQLAHELGIEGDDDDEDEDDEEDNKPAQLMKLLIFVYELCLHSQHSLVERLESTLRRCHASICGFLDDSWVESD
jgi:hypothetical protein